MDRCLCVHVSIVFHVVLTVLQIKHDEASLPGSLLYLNVFNSMSVMPSPFGGHKHKQERNQVICSSEKELLVLNSHIYVVFHCN